MAQSAFVPCDFGCINPATGRPCPDGHRKTCDGMKLWHAVKHGNCVEINKVFEHGSVSLNTQNREGNTPLHVAAWHNQRYSARALLKLGADPRTMNNKGETPMDAAIAAGHGRIVTLLQDAIAAAEAADALA